jgi:hypothetical protein
MKASVGSISKERMARNDHSKREKDVQVTINLHAKSDFDKGDVGRVTGHQVTKVDGLEKGSSLVTALQAIRAGENGWFETKTNGAGERPPVDVRVY